MSIVQLPSWRLRGHAGFGLRPAGGDRPRLHVLSKFERAMPGKVFCDRCATPIELGAVMHGQGVYCSVECSLEGPVRPA